MHNKESIMNDLNKAGINSIKTLMVHSSYKAIGQIEGGPQTVINSLMTYTKHGLLLLPTILGMIQISLITFMIIRKSLHVWVI